jgi:uncharacterized protein YjiS (DUF1127 family)
MKLFNNVISNGPLNVSNTRYGDRFNRQLQGYSVFAGLTHGQVEARYDSRAIHIYAERGRLARSQTIVGVFKKSLGSAQYAGRRLLDWISERRRLHRAVRELSSLNERTLRDIGISRHDIATIASGSVTVAQINARRHVPASRSVRLISEVITPRDRGDRFKTVKPALSLDRAA